MTDDEWRSWQRSNDDCPPGSRAVSPCSDCTLSFAQAMRAIDRCDGEPRGSARDSPRDAPETLAPLSVSA